MITGRVNEDLQPAVLLRVRGPSGSEKEVEAIVDTAFNGFLALPTAVILALDLVRLGMGRALLADGASVVFQTYEGTVLWDRELRPVEVDETSGATLIGTSLLHGHDLAVQVVQGGRVTIEPLRT